jgi:hypothetical protein
MPVQPPLTTCWALCHAHQVLLLLSISLSAPPQPWQKFADAYAKPPRAVVDEVQLFLQHKFLFWLEAHSCMQTLRDGPGTTLPLFLNWTVVSANTGYM